MNVFAVRQQKLHTRPDWRIGLETFHEQLALLQMLTTVRQMIDRIRAQTARPTNKSCIISSQAKKKTLVHLPVNVNVLVRGSQSKEIQILQQWHPRKTLPDKVLFDTHGNGKLSDRVWDQLRNGFQRRPVMRMEITIGVPRP